MSGPVPAGISQAVTGPVPGMAWSWASWRARGAASRPARAVRSAIWVVQRSITVSVIAKAAACPAVKNAQPGASPYGAHANPARSKAKNTGFR